MDVQDGVLVLIPERSSSLQGLHNEIWKEVDVNEYLNTEREAWKK